jgi:hypothetical protein
MDVPHGVFLYMGAENTPCGLLRAILLADEQISS